VKIPESLTSHVSYLDEEIFQYERRLLTAQETMLNHQAALTRLRKEKQQLDKVIALVLAEPEIDA